MMTVDSIQTLRSDRECLSALEVLRAIGRVRERNRTTESPNLAVQPSSTMRRKPRTNNTLAVTDVHRTLSRTKA
jgi:hypothetical protein